MHRAYSHALAQLRALIKGPDQVATVAPAVDYALVPLCHLLQNQGEVLAKASGREAVVLETLRAVDELFTRCLEIEKPAHSISTRAESFSGLFRLLLSLVAPSAPEGQQNPAEVRMLAMAATSSLLRVACAPPPVTGDADGLAESSRAVVGPAAGSSRELIFSPDFRAPFGYLVSTLLDAARSTANGRPLRLAAMHTLSDIATEFSDSAAGLQVLSTFLPGVLGALFSVLVGDFKQGSTIVVKAFELWTQVVVAVLADDRLRALDALPKQDRPTDAAAALASWRQQALQGKDARPNPRFQPPASKKRQQQDPRDIGVVCDAVWAGEAGARLVPLLKRVYSADLDGGSVDPNSSTVLASVASAGTLLQRCRLSLRLSTTPMLEHLISCAEHPLPAVASHAQHTLQQLAPDRGVDTGAASATTWWELYDFSVMLEDNLHRHLSSLPRVLSSGKESEKLAHLRLIIGYIRLVGASPTSSRGTGNKLVLLWLSSFARLSKAMLSALQIDSTDAAVMEREADEEGNGESSYFQTRFVHAQSTESRRLLLDVMFLTGQAAGPAVGQLLDLWIGILTDPGRRNVHKEVLLALSCMTLGAASNNGEASPSVLGQTDRLLGEVLSARFWRPRLISSPAQRTSPIPLDQVRDNAVLCSLAVRVVADVAQAQGKAFQMGLIRVLYPLLERLGQPDELVSQAALASLHRVARSMGCASLSALVLENADYLVDAISAQLRAGDYSEGSDDEDSSPTLPRVLQALLDRTGAGEAVVPLLDDIMQSVLGRLADLQRQQHTARGVARQQSGVSSDSYLKVVCSVVGAIARQREQATAAVEPMEPVGPVAAAPISETQGYYDAARIRERLCARLAARRRKREEAEALAARPAGEAGAEWWREREEEEQKLEAEKEAREEKKLEQAAEDDKAEEEADKLSGEQQTLKDVLRQCRHFLASAEPSQQLLVLTIVELSVPGLADKQNTLLPLAAQLWPPLRIRLKQLETTVLAAPAAPTLRLLPSGAVVSEAPAAGTERYKPVFIKLLQVLEVMSEHCGKFLAQRFAQDVWPAVRNVMQQELRAMWDVREYSAQYTSSNAFKVQLSVLRCLRRLLSSSVLGSKHAKDMAALCAEYLSADQHELLREEADAVVQHLRSLDEDAVWWSLHRVGVNVPVSVRKPRRAGPHSVLVQAATQRNPSLAPVLMRALAELDEPAARDSGIAVQWQSRPEQQLKLY